jgi:hypothetical protein
MSNNNVVSSSKFSDILWTLVEKKLSNADIKRNQILCDLGEDIHNDNYTEQIKLIAIGNDYYLRVRDELNKYIKFDKIKKNDVKKSKKISKKIQITLDNSYNNISDILNILKNYFEEKNIVDYEYENLIKSIDYIELRILILMKYIDYYIKKYKKSNDRNIKEILLGSKKILYNLKKNKTNFRKIFYLENYDIELSDYLIDDFTKKIDELNSLCNYNIYEIANEYPKLIFDTNYDMTIPEIKLKPYKTQVELINDIKNNFDDGFMINLRVLTGLGKTSSITAICKYIKNMNNSNIKVIFACSDLLDTVRIQVAKLMFNFQIKFGIGVGKLSEDSSKIDKIVRDGIDEIDSNVDINIDKLPSYKITTSYNCGKAKKSDSNEIHQDKKLSMCDAIICDYITTYMLLKEKKYEYIVFFDEPTIGINNNVVLFYLSQILYNSSKRMILSSATLPLKSEIDNYFNYFQNKYEEARICDISSNKVLVGCIIKDFNNNTITPHINCKNKKELKLFLNKIKNYPLLGKFYTLTFLINLNKFMNEYNLGIKMDEIETFDHSYILENILLLIEKVCDNDEINFENFINIKCKDIDENKFVKDEIPDDYYKIVPEKLLTKHAFKYLGCCLISVNSPKEYVENNFKETINKLKEKLKISSVKKMYENYIKKIEVINNEIKNCNDTMKEDVNGSKEERLRKLNEKKPTFPFPKKLQINTEEHIQQFSKYAKDYDKSLVKQTLDCKNIDINYYVISDDIKFLLYMGVGLYCKDLDAEYCNLVLNLLNERKLAFIIADDSFCYGANYAISSVIINDSIGDLNTINTILQLIGRTGRVGKSEIGQAYIDNNTLRRLINFFNNDDNNDEEGLAISDAFEKVKNYNIQQEEIKKIYDEKQKQRKIELEKRLKKEKEMAEKKALKEQQELEKRLKEEKEKEDEWIRNDNNFDVANNNYQNNNQNNYDNNDNDDNWRGNNTVVLNINNNVNNNENKKKKKIDKSKLFGSDHNKELSEEQKKFRERFL